MPTYPPAFRRGRGGGPRGQRPGVLCNRPCNGLEAIESFGAEHMAGGELIVYTSQDSVLQIAAHVDVVAPAELYAICAGVRDGCRPSTPSAG